MRPLGILALLLVLALAVEVGRKIARGLLGERESHSVAAMASILGIAAAGLPANLLMRTTGSFGVVVTLLLVLPAGARVGLSRRRLLCRRAPGLQPSGPRRRMGLCRSAPPPEVRPPLPGPL